MRATAAASPFTCTSGKTSWAITDSSHSPLASPLEADSHVSIVCGPESGEATLVAWNRPKKAPICVLPGLMRRKPQRSGIVREARRIVAARSFVRALQAWSRVQTAAYLRTCSSVIRGYQRKLPGGLTPISTERSMLFGYRQA